MSQRFDVIVVGAGHNGLVAALLLARAGLQVAVFEEQSVVGGAVRTERPFAKVPALGASTGAYLLGLMPPELLAALNLNLPLLRRDPHYFLPTLDHRYLLFGSDRTATAAKLRQFFSEADLAAEERLQEELAALREDVAPTWMREPLSIEDTAERYVRPALRRIFIDLCRGSVGDYLNRFGFQSELIRAMYAVTDGFSGLDGTWDTPGTGMNFLVHNMCRLPSADGTWMIVKGGMGTVTSTLAQAAAQAGATFFTQAPITHIETHGKSVKGVQLGDGRHFVADVVVVGADPFRLREMVGDGVFAAEHDARLAAWRRPGTTLKVNLALRDLPRFHCLPATGDLWKKAFGPTIHLLPQKDGLIEHLRTSYAAVKRGELDDFPTIEWYVHTTVDPSLRDSAGHHNSALFVQWVPYQPAQGRWEDDGRLDRYVQQLLSICDRFAPGTSSLVADVYALPPPEIERRFGIRHGHIHHIDNSFGFADRHPYATSVAGLYSCSAGCHPAGSVIGCAGYIAAQRVLFDLSKVSDQNSANI